VAVRHILLSSFAVTRSIEYLQWLRSTAMTSLPDVAVRHILLSNYGVFGDVISVDATYSANQYNMKFVPFTGVNHYL